MAQGQPTQGARDMAAEAPPADGEAEIMARNGITRVPAFQYHVDGYRYSSLADALAYVRLGARGRADRSGPRP